jgi:hypothetical protein
MLQTALFPSAAAPAPHCPPARAARLAPGSMFSATERQAWIGVVSREHVRRGVAGGFIQLNHGQKAPVGRMRAGDRIAMYSPRVAYPDGTPLQCFTAIGVVLSGTAYQVEMALDFRPWRIDVAFAPCREVPIRPLIDRLSFIRSKTQWGAAFRFGYLKVPAEDFALIASAMRVDWPAE